jgi:protein ImuB
MDEPAKDRQAEVRQILALLHKWGIHTLGQLAALDKEDLAARLGPEAIWLWEQANGQSTRLLKFIQPSESFAESFEFENEIETAEPLLFMLRRFLEQLALRLNGIYLVAKELTLQITFSNSQRYERIFKIPQPTNDVDLLFRMLQTHLENFKSEHPIVAVALDAQPVKPASQQFRLFETALRDPNQLSETLARLTGLLGTDRVGTPVLEETHRPDAFRMEPFAWNVSIRFAADSPRDESVRLADTAASTEEEKDALSVALRRFRSTESASVFLSENVPAHIRSTNISGKIADQGGPYFASGNWWDEKSWTRAEWDLQLDDNVLLRCHQSGETWEVDGVYD